MVEMMFLRLLNQTLVPVPAFDPGVPGDAASPWQQGCYWLVCWDWLRPVVLMPSMKTCSGFLSSWYETVVGFIFAHLNVSDTY